MLNYTFALTLLVYLFPRGVSQSFLFLSFVFIAFVYVKINKLIYRNFNHITTSWRMFHFKMNVECGLSIECTNPSKSLYWFGSFLFGPSVMNRAVYMVSGSITVNIIV